MADAQNATLENPKGFLTYFDRLLSHTDILFAMAIIGILAVLLFPIPIFLLDLLLSLSITFSVVILMTVLFIDKSLKFNSFPTILLIAAIFRLSLNIASTRLILSQGHTGPAAAGHVIKAFGNFVMEGSIVIGALIFIILTLINFIVITKGSGRIAEVSARFSLDAMPGKQMAIDADLSAGLIDEATAKVRRKELEDESTFYGAMDGASKFVRGDAIAGLIITFINFIAGILIGVIQRDLEFKQAMETYTILTIGDGLVSQIPAIIVSMAAGLLVTKSGVDGSAEKAVLGQLGSSPQALALSSGLLIFLGAMPGMPFVPFALLSATTGAIGWYVWKYKPDKRAGTFAAAGKAGAAGRGATGAPGKTGAAAAPGEEAKPEEEPISKTLHIDSLRLELGYGLLPLINYQKGHRLTDQIRALRTQIARDLGFVMPSVRIQDNMQLGNLEYVIKVKDIECGKGTVRPDRLLVMNPTGGPITLEGEDTTEPAFGLPAKWVPENLREEALFRNYTVVDPPTVVTTHLTEIIKDNVTDLMAYGETQKLLDELDEGHRPLVSDLIPSQITVSGLQRVLQNLLAEGVSIRDLPGILEAISEASRVTHNMTAISEHVRARLARQISHANTSTAGYIPIVALSVQWEQTFSESLVGKEGEQQLSIAPSKLQEFIARVRKVFEEHAMRGELPVLLTSPAIRPYVRSIIERFRPSTVVMSQNEIHPKAKIKTLGQI
jgi:flagellar biosynthesis protein FlhA